MGATSNMLLSASHTGHYSGKPLPTTAEPSPTLPCYPSKHNDSDYTYYQNYEYPQNTQYVLAQQVPVFSPGNTLQGPSHSPLSKCSPSSEPRTPPSHSMGCIEAHKISLSPLTTVGNAYMPNHGGQTSPVASHGGHLLSDQAPKCYEHGCNGRVFSTHSNLLRHVRERSGSALKSECPRCGARFTRKTAMTAHMRQNKCRQGYPRLAQFCETAQADQSIHLQYVGIKAPQSGITEARPLEPCLNASLPAVASI